MSKEESKQCKLCCKEMDTRAKRCPHCMASQGRLGVWPYWISVLIVFLIIMGPTLIDMMYDTAPSYERALFTDHKNEIEITDTTLYFSETGCEGSGTLLIMGRIKNDGAITWTDISFEVSFHDEDGKLIDTAQENDYDFVLPPNEEIPFKFSIRRNFPEESYGAPKLRIISAIQKRGYY